MNVAQTNALALVGSALGGLIGYFVFFWIAGFGFYGMVIPGGLLGVGAGLFKSRSIAIAVICGLAALALGLFTEWRFAPFVADGSLGYFLTHLHELSPISLIMIAAGAAIGFWCPFRHYLDRPATKP